MGVHGLWTLLQPVARPVTLETLRDKRLAIDASMWLYQFQMATRDRKTGDVIYGAHIMGTFRRIMKLLFYGVKPVFVFDGDAPTLKKRTIEQRRRRKQGAGRDLAKTAQELLAAQLRSAAAEREIARRKERIAAAEAGQEWSDNEDNPASKSAAANDKPVYLEDLNKSVSPIKPRRDVLRDDYALPRIEGSLESRAKPSDPRIATEEELRDFLDDLRPEDLDLNSKFFGDLPTEVKYEIIGDLRIKTRQVNHRRVQQMRGTAAIDFSKAQIEHLMERNSYTQKLLSITDELGKSAIAIPSRVAGQRNREYVLLKQDASKGGGWVLGVKNPEISNTDPITIESTTDESVDERTDTDEFEEVGFDSPEKAPVGLPTPDVEARRALAEEAIFARFAAKKAADQLDPYLDQPSAVRNGSTDLFHGEGGAEEADPALQQALYESVQHGPLPPDDNHSSARFSGHSRDGANRTPTRPPATTTAARDIVVKIPPAPQAPFAAPLSDTDDDFEYVDAPPAQVPEQQASAPALAPPEQMPPEQMILSDTDASDEFEEVGVASTTPAPPPPPAQRSSRALDANDHSAPTAAKSASTMPVRSLLDSVLPSDSESETEQSPKRKLAPLPRGPGHEPIAPIRLSPSPDPFERFEASQQNAASPEAGASNGVRAQDFAQAAATNSGSATDKAKDDNAAERPAPPVRPRPRKSPSYNGGPSPAELPASVPTSERALDAIQTAEMAVLPEVLASMPSPEPEVASEASRENASQQTPHPAEAATSAEAEPIVQYLDDLERPIRALQAEKVDDGPSKAATPSVTKTSKPRPTVQYLEDLENPTNVRPGPAAPGQPADDEEFFSDWSRSPSPQPRASGEPGGQPLFLEDDDPDAEEAALAMMREEEAYADVMAQLRNGSIESMRVEAEKEVARLSAQKRAEMRNADGVTRQMAIDIREMLVLFGIPFVDAPSEAEAECASLLERKLVDGIVTDDSDVFLFGGSRIYRNMFNEAKYVECYLLADLEREIGLDRSKLVRLAYLLGSDYTDGLPGVGVVAGRELLEEFPGDDGLKDFRAWWDKVQKGVDTQADTNTSWKKRFKSGHRQLVIDQGWPSAEVRQAYYRPVVDDSEERFSWGTVDLDGLRMYLHRSLGWGQAKSDSILLPLIKREQERKEGTLKAQAMVTDFFDYSAGERPFARKKQPKYASKRLQNVVQAWKDRSHSPKTGDQGKIEEMADDAVGSADEAVEAPQPKKRKRASKPATAPKAKSRKKSTAASRKRAEKERRDARAAANGGVYSSEEDLGSDREAGNASAAAGPPARVQPARKKRKSAVILEPLSDVSE